MSRSGIGSKRKRDDIRPQTDVRKRRAIQNDEDVVSNLERIEQGIEEEPTKYREKVEHLIRILDSASQDTKASLKIGVSLCKIFSRFVGSEYSTGKNEHRGRQNQEQHDWYLQQFRRYRAQLVKLLRLAPQSQQLPILHLCWKVLEQDAELLDKSTWSSDSIFQSLLSTVIGIPNGTDVRETFMGEYLSQCHDCCYHSLEYLSSVNFPLVPIRRSLTLCVKNICFDKQE